MCEELPRVELLQSHLFETPPPRAPIALIRTTPHLPPAPAAACTSPAHPSPTHPSPQHRLTQPLASPKNYSLHSERLTTRVSTRPALSINMAVQMAAKEQASKEEAAEDAAAVGEGVEEEEEEKGIKLSEVEQHASIDDLWLVIDGRAQCSSAALTPTSWDAHDLPPYSAWQVCIFAP